MSDILIKVDNVSKKFAKDLKKSLLYGIADVGRGMLGKPFNPELREGEFWAVRDVSFEVRRGECLGLIGHNGAGKSTLLKMLNGLIRPDKGRIEMRGRIGALIELGAGFNPILTGRENIYNSGAVLGFTRAEINKKFDEIVAFSELEDFLDMPVQSYSSGMKVRLGFAVAAHTEPDVLLIDEVLAVGDIGFRVKCMNRISELLTKCAVIFISHSMTQIARICTSGMLLDKGKLQLKTPDVGKLIEAYYAHFDVEESSVIGSGAAKVLSIDFFNYERIISDKYIFESDFIGLRARISVQSHVSYFAVHCFINDVETRPIAISSSISEGFIFQNDNHEHSIEIQIPTSFTDGTFTLHFTIVEIFGERRVGETLISLRACLKFVISKNTYPASTSIQLPSLWKIDK